MRRCSSVVVELEKPETLLYILGIRGKIYKVSVRDVIETETYKTMQCFSEEQGKTTKNVSIKVGGNKIAILMNIIVRCFP